MGGEGGTPTKGAKPSSTSQVGVEGGTQGKSAKPSSTQQEQPATPAFPDWTAAFQAYYGPGVSPPPPPYFATTVASGPTPHPYIWGGQPLMSPYGTAPQYAAMYPPGGIYGHPSIPLGAHAYNQYGVPTTPNPADGVLVTSAPPSTEAEVKSSGTKERNSIKRVKGSLGKLEIVSRKGEGGKTTCSSANGGFSQSGDSGSEGSSEGSEEDNSQNGSDTGRKRSFESFSMNGMSGHDMNTPSGEAKLTASRSVMGSGQSASAAEKAVVGLPTTNLNIGRDFWNASAPASGASAKGRRVTTAIASPLVTTNSQLIQAGRDGVHSDLWAQDERELKRQRRKQSNRESARRSRLRKQAECEELTTKVDALSAENMTLRNELARLAEESKELSSQNASLLEQLRNVQGEDIIADLGKRGARKGESHFNQPGGKEHFEFLSKVTNTSSSQRSEQQDHETHDSTGKTHLVLETNSHSDTVAAG